MPLRSTKWVDWTCIKVRKSLLSICNKNHFKVYRSNNHTHGFTSVGYCNSYFNWLFDLFLVTDPWKMLAISYFGRNWSVCMESRTGNMIFIIDQHDIYGFIWQAAWLIAVFSAKRPSSGGHLAEQKKNKFGVQFFLDGVCLVQLLLEVLPNLQADFFGWLTRKLSLDVLISSGMTIASRSNWKAVTFWLGRQCFSLLITRGGTVQHANNYQALHILW